jgi:GLPGLI family protein
MKKTSILLTTILALSINTHAQITAGTITYDESVQMKAALPAEAAEMKGFFPNEIHTPHVLLFTQDASVYQNAPQKQAPVTKSAPVEEGTYRVTMNISSHDDIIYTDLKDGKTIEQTDLFSRKFLIMEEAKKRAWHNTGREKTILGYACQEAVSTTPKDTVTAWFTTSIPVASGPGNWAGLPGMILEASQKSAESNLTITATKIEEGLGGKSLPDAPSSGKKVTREEYTAIADAKKKEMQQQFGGNGNMIIHIVNQER